MRYPHQWTPLPDESAGPESPIPLNDYNQNFENSIPRLSA